MRYSSIDILRMIAIFVMVLVHFAGNLSGVHLPISGFGAPLFAFLSGLSYRLWVNGLQAKGVAEEEISKRSIRRGLFVFGVGFAFNIFVWLPEDTFNWDVLTFIGFALLMNNGLRRLPLPIPILVAVMAVFVSPVLREMADYLAYWSSGYFESDLTLTDVTIGFLVTGYFPIFPWLAYSIAGLATGTLLFDATPEPVGRNATSTLPSPGEALAAAPHWQIVYFGAALIATSIILLVLGSKFPEAVSKKMLGGWTMFPPTMEYVFGTLGIAMVSFGLLHQWVDRNPRALRHKGWLSIAKTFSRYSFTIYVLHHVVHLWPLWIYGVATGNEPTIYWQKAMPVSASLPLAFLFLAICYFSLRKIGPDRRLGIEGWMRWLCD